MLLIHSEISWWFHDYFPLIIPIFFFCFFLSTQFQPFDFINGGKLVKYLQMRAFKYLPFNFPMSFNFLSFPGSLSQIILIFQRISLELSRDIPDILLEFTPFLSNVLCDQINELNVSFDVVVGWCYLFKSDSFRIGFKQTNKGKRTTLLNVCSFKIISRFYIEWRWTVLNRLTFALGTFSF